MSFCSSSSIGEYVFLVLFHQIRTIKQTWFIYLLKANTKKNCPVNCTGPFTKTRHTMILSTMLHNSSNKECRQLKSVNTHWKLFVCIQWMVAFRKKINVIWNHWLCTIFISLNPRFAQRSYNRAVILASCHILKIKQGFCTRMEYIDFPPAVVDR